MKKIAILIGSTRRESYSRKVAHFLRTNSPRDMELSIVEIGHLPLYNEDFEQAVPAAWAEFRQAVTTFDAVLFITPEYNRSVPAVLKNAIDVGSRPFGKSVWKGKPAAVVSLSIGNLSGFGANHHLRQSLVFLDMPTMSQPEIYLANVQNLLNESGMLVNEQTIAFLSAAMSRFGQWISATAAFARAQP